MKPIAIFSTFFVSFFILAATVCSVEITWELAPRLAKLDLFVKVGVLVLVLGMVLVLGLVLVLVLGMVLALVEIGLDVVVLGVVVV